MKLSHSPLWLLAFTLVAVIGVQSPAHGAGPEAIASRACDVSSALRAYGPTYTRALSVRRATCRGGKNFIREWDKCRRRRGGSDGSCPHVLRYSCEERRYDKIRTQYTATVYCKRRGGRRVKFVVNIYYADNG
jgi:hypothetical protein